MTHVTDVKPLIEVVTYTDQENGNEVYQEVRNWRILWIGVEIGIVNSYHSTPLAYV